MKKLFGTILLGCVAISGSAQAQGIYQFEDPGFEQYTEGEEPKQWNSFSSAIANGFAITIGKNGAPRPSSSTPGANNTQYAVKLYSKNIVGSNANGNLTTGVINMGSTTPEDPKNHNFTKTDDPKHSLRFAGRPDAVTFYAKFKAGKDNKGKCGNANFILHDKCNYKDPEDKTQLGNRIGKASQLISASSEWVKYTVDFVYDKEQTEEQYLLASVTTNPVPGESANDELYFDEVYFIYNSSLSDLKYNGTTIAGFQKDVYEYNIKGSYTDGCLTAIKDCAGGSSEISFDKTTNVATITIKGDDWNVNKDNQHIYHVQFAIPNVVINNDFTFDFETGLQKITFNRALPAGWNTICLPFATKTSDFGSDVIAQAFTSATKEGLNFKNVTKLEANKPYLIYFPNGFSKSLNFTADITSTSPIAIKNGDWSFIGTYTGLAAGEMTGKYGVMTNENKGQSIRKAGNSASIKGTRAYFEYNGTANVNSIKLNLEGETTGIDAIVGNSANAFPANIYSLDGRMIKANAMNLNGLSKGIYVVNGKKIIVK